MRNKTAQPDTSRTYSRSHEPIAWSLFGAGGMVVAFITPALLVISTLLAPIGIVERSPLTYQNVIGFIQTGWGALVILIVISLQLFHAAHRIYHGLHDLHIDANRKIMLWVFYGGASLLTAITAVLLFGMG
jgi:fumarate reductase subunit D